MNQITLEFLKFTVDSAFSLAAPAFASLRQTASKHGVKKQYYGVLDDDPNQLVWCIQWPGISQPAELADQSGDFRQKLNALDVKSQPTSWLLPFRFEEEILPALNAPMTEFAFVILKDTTNTGMILDSLHRTFSDCYYAKGFTGGSWGIATNNDRVCLYLLGWESRAHHREYSKSPIFALEIDNLAPNFAPGSVGLFSKLARESTA
ncbi:hypothetical protein D9758_003099 [Tetrapyrgos nigripes]|uniref:Uncharacterized protein n=1 Tax=Tetrapyrgos nigripes TaxID=182062 RepID=A0A8H5GQB3_9AGAR|nr:hypothetical protein D9758_003099 [Tetrapyrgos nigripes]